jgi:O-phospho-L-seryl-tRNASec:L-selenocysteinyl-tRNA synthase
MNTDELSKAFQALGIPKTHATVGISNIVSANKQYRALLVNRRMPEHGWSDVQIQNLLFLLSVLDTNNKTMAMGGENDDDEARWCGVGEREGRVFSSLVAQRHFGLSHGIGRSGDITEPQPKAAGSSVLAKLALFMTLDALRRGSGLNAQGPAAHGILLPLCTGMSMSLVLSSLRSSDTAKTIVLWSRIDQKSCYKAISSAGLICVVVPTKVEGDAVVTDMEAMAAAMEAHEGKILAVITTTSCFAPRVPDAVDKVAKLCAVKGIGHVINNAYGLQCAQTSKLINRACVIGRVDAIVCSTDKNFLVPVGGAIVVSPSKTVINEIGKIYAGRASASPIIDLFITLLAMGLKGYTRLLEERTKILETFPCRLEEVAKKHGERLLICPGNTISFGVTLDGLARPKHDHESEGDYTKSIAKEISSFGAMLFTRCVSGTRVVPRAHDTTIGDYKFEGFGSSTSNFPHAYMTAACAIGVSAAEVKEFFVRFDKALTEFANKIADKAK